MTPARLPLRVAFVGGFAACFVEPVRARLQSACELLAGEERDLLPRLADVDVVPGLHFRLGQYAVLRTRHAKGGLVRRDLEEVVAFVEDGANIGEPLRHVDAFDGVVTEILE